MSGEPTPSALQRATKAWDRAMEQRGDWRNRGKTLRECALEQFALALDAHAKAATDATLEKAAQACENERRCYADNHRAHDTAGFCHDQDAAAIRAMKGSDDGDK